MRICTRSVPLCPARPARGSVTLASDTCPPPLPPPPPRERMLRGIVGTLALSGGRRACHWGWVTSRTICPTSVCLVPLLRPPIPAQRASTGVPCVRRRRTAAACGVLLPRIPTAAIPQICFLSACRHRLARRLRSSLGGSKMIVRVYATSATLTAVTGSAMIPTSSTLRPIVKPVLSVQSPHSVATARRIGMLPAPPRRGSPAALELQRRMANASSSPTSCKFRCSYFLPRGVPGVSGCLLVHVGERSSRSSPPFVLYAPCLCQSVFACTHSAYSLTLTFTLSLSLSQSLSINVSLSLPPPPSPPSSHPSLPLSLSLT